jgi:hypothetical protein
MKVVWESDSLLKICYPMITKMMLLSGLEGIFLPSLRGIIIKYLILLFLGINFCGLEIIFLEWLSYIVVGNQGPIDYKRAGY